MKPLEKLRVLTLALNLPGPLAAARLGELGSEVLKIEPPAGDPLARARPDWYRILHDRVRVVVLDLKDPASRDHLESELASTDVLLTANRPASLARLGLAWDGLHTRHPRLCHAALVGYPPPDEDRPGHDLTYQAGAGLVAPPELPRTCLADVAGADRLVAAVLGLLLARERGRGAGQIHISLAETAADFAAPLRYGLTAPGGMLAGAIAGYNLYRARRGWVAVATLEPHFAERLVRHLEIPSLEPPYLEAALRERTADEWDEWGRERELPLVAVRGPDRG